MITSTRLLVCIIAIVASVPAFGQKKRNRAKDAPNEVITYDSEGLKVVQEGNNNVVAVDQTDSTTNIHGNKEAILIDRNGNRIYHNRSSSEEASSPNSDNKTTNSTNINQSGNGNSVKIKQSGKGNSVSISQGGKRRKEE